MRSSRDVLTNMFNKDKSISRGKEHWDTNKWISSVKIFAEAKLNFSKDELTEQNIAILALIINHAFGETGSKKPEPYILKVLGKEGVKLFHSIF